MNAAADARHPPLNGKVDLLFLPTAPPEPLSFPSARARYEALRCFEGRVRALDLLSLRAGGYLRLEPDARLPEAAERQTRSRAGRLLRSSPIAGQSASPIFAR
jgi:hypothetical protein